MQRQSPYDRQHSRHLRPNNCHCRPLPQLFIAAEVVAYDDFKAAEPVVKGFAAVKAAGKFRTEGARYIVQDGDIIQFKIGQASKR